jgi:hypothetical protein
LERADKHLVQIRTAYRDRTTGRVLRSGDRVALDHPAVCGSNANRLERNLARKQRLLKTKISHHVDAEILER